MLGGKPFELHARPRVATADETRRFEDWLRQRRQGTPLAYLTHRAPFLDFDLYVDERVLVPRPETEELVELTCRERTTVRRALDLGTGSGAIAIAIARRFPTAEVQAVDRSASALEVARRNAVSLGVAGRVHCARHDLRVFDPAWSGTDLVIGNPPYVRTDELAALPPEVRAEPRIALDGGPDGTDYLMRIIEQGPAVLAPDGLVALEIDPRQTAALTAAARGRYTRSDFRLDSTGRTRFLFLWR